MRIPGSGFTSSHPDFHLPDNVEVGAEFDAKRYVAVLKKAGVDLVYFFAKCHYGNSYYYTNVGHRHPHLKRDLLREISDACRKERIKIIAYFTGGIDTYAAKQHNDWRRVDKNNTVLAPLPMDANEFVSMCLLGPYTEKWLIPQMAEAAEHYQVDGMMTDMMTSFLCYCPHCKEQYLADTGRPLPSEENGEGWNEFCRWRFQKKEEFVEKVTKGVHKVNPALPLAFNWMYSFLDPSPVHKGIGYLVADINQQENEQLLWLSQTARYFASTGLPFEVMTGRFLHGLGDWSIRPVEMLKQEMVTVAANGGRCTLIDRQLPDGNLDEAYYARLGEVFGFIHERKPVFENAQVMKQIAILHSLESIFGPNKEFYGPARRYQTVEGASMVMTDLSRHSTVTNEFNLEKNLAEYETVILPEQYALPPTLLGKLRCYVKAGGTLIASHRSCFEGTRWLFPDVFGCDFEGEYPSAFGYVMLKNDQDRSEYANVPFMIHGACARLRARGCQVLAELHEPMTNSLFGHGKAPPKKNASSPGVTINCYGKGKAAYIAGPIFVSMKDFYNPAGLYLVRKILEKTVPEPLLDVQCAPGVEVTLTSQKDRININLINTDGERGINIWSLVQAIRPAGKIRILLKTKKRPVSVTRLPENRKITFAYKNGVLHCSVSNVHIHTCVQVKLKK